MSLPEISSRPVNDGDRSFLLRLYASVREAEMALVPWTTEQKRAFIEMQFAAQIRGYAEVYPQALHQIICRNGQPAGRIYWSREAERLHILDITVDPQWRNQGIGSRVLNTLLEEADRDAKPVTIHVEDFNPSRRLFERLGFEIASQDGFMLQLRRPPRAGASESGDPGEEATSSG